LAIVQGIHHSLDATNILDESFAMGVIHLGGWRREREPIQLPACPSFVALVVILDNSPAGMRFARKCRHVHEDYSRHASAPRRSRIVCGLVGLCRVIHAEVDRQLTLLQLRNIRTVVPSTGTTSHFDPKILWIEKVDESAGDNGAWVRMVDVKSGKSTHHNDLNSSEFVSLQRPDYCRS
jgi:hypothetical protein